MPQTKPLNFEEAMAELEAISKWFESSDVDLDEGVKKFERGMELAAQLKDHLAEIENKVEKVKARFDTRASAASDTDLLD